MPRADGPLCILEKINNNAYKLDLPDEYKVNNTFTVRDLSPYLEDGVADEELKDLRANPPQQGGNDETQWEETTYTRSITRSRGKLVTLLVEVI